MREQVLILPEKVAHGQPIPGVFEVSDPKAPAWPHAQIWAAKIVISKNGSKP